MDFTRINDLNDLQYWLIVNGVSHKIVFILGILIVCTFVIQMITKKLKIPSVVGYVLLGTLFSVSVLDRIPFLSNNFIEWYSYLINSFNFIPTLAVSFISFTIGTALSIKVLKRLELEFTLIVLLESIGAFILVFLGMLAVGQPLFIALILGAIATATAPAATVMVLKEYGGEGELSATLMIVLALDEALALIIFSFIEPISMISINPDLKFTLVNTFFLPLGKVVGAVILGLVVGYYSQKKMADYHSKTRKVLLILATVLGVASLAVAMDMSHMIASMAVGFAYRNFAKKRLDIADRIDTLTIPLFAIYFILAGTRIEIGNITSELFLLVALVYAVTRIIGKVGGASLGARLSNAPAKVTKYIGLGLLPQIGITIDLAYVIQQDFIHISARATEVSLLIFNIILYTTVITEIFGPLATEFALNKSGEMTIT